MNKATYVIIILILNFYSCFTDVDEKIKLLEVSARDIESILISTDVSKYPTVKDTTDFTLMAWRGVPDEYLSIDRIIEVKDAGLNLMFYPYKSIETLKQVLDYSKIAGIKTLISCPELYTYTDSVVRLFKDHPANGGYFLQDEPTLSYITQLSELTSKIEAVDNTRFTYINLLPYYGTSDYDSTTEKYINYIQRFTTETPLKVLSFDHYPIVQNRTRFTWYHNLEIIKKIAKEADIPFWSFAMSSAHSSYSIPTIEHLRLQVYSNIAYGTKGIQYFTYWMPDRHPYTSGPIDSKGNRTNEYYLLKEMNNEVQILSHIYLTCNSYDVSFYGNVPQGTKEFSKPPYYMKSIQIKGGDALLSEMKNENNDFFMIQNINLHNEISVKVQVDTLSSIVLKSGKIIPASLINEEIKITPGDILLFMR
ncbi:MAG: hypothetical protein PHE29_02250 [Tissierellia bacterium]|nr:hypothetical protein [Tissierellia bacterium]